MKAVLYDGGIQTLNGTYTTSACHILEFQPDGTVVWSWSASEHFDAVVDSLNPYWAADGPDGTAVVDTFHCNSIDVDPVHGDLLVSSRQMSSIFYIQKATHKVLWKMGGSPASKDGATYVPVADPFFGQHDVRLQPGWDPDKNGGTGQISLFDDHTYGPGPARGVVYDVVVGSKGQTGHATVAWEFAGSGPSPATGSFRISADGSRVIGWGLRPGFGFTEVDGAGHDLLDLSFSDGNTTYRAIKVPLVAFDRDVLRRTAGLR
jgi:hypothetical protein